MECTPVLVSFASCVIIRISCMQGHVCMQYPCSQNAHLLLLLPAPGFCSHVTVCLLNGTALCSLVTGLRILLLWSSEEGDFLCFRVICSLNQKLERKECILYNEQTYDNYIPCNYLNCLLFWLEFLGFNYPFNTPCRKEKNCKYVLIGSNRLSGLNEIIIGHLVSLQNKL